MEISVLWKFFLWNREKSERQHCSYLILDFNLKIGENESIGAIKEMLTVYGNNVFYLELYSIKNQDLHYNCLEISSENILRYMKYKDLLLNKLILLNLSQIFFFHKYDIYIT